MIKKNKSESGLGQDVDYSRQTSIPESKLKFGSVKNLIPVHVDSKTIVFVQPDRDVNQIIEKYKAHQRKF